MRRILSVLTAVLMMVCFVPQASAEPAAKAYCVVSAGANESISEYNADESTGVAGLSKLPAVLTLCRAVDRSLLPLDAEITVGKRASEIGGPSAYLKSGENIQAEPLLQASVMISAGDAICALLDHAFGSEDVSLQNINLTLKEIGVERQLSRALGTSESFTCRELAAMGIAACGSETFLKYCGVKYAVLHHADGRETELANANKLLSTLPGCIGLMTGSSKPDGYCGVFACKRGDSTLICTMTGAPNSKTRFEVAAKLFEEAFANYAVFDLASTDEPILERYPVENGDAETVDLYVKENVSLLLKKSDGEPEREWMLPDTLKAPLDPDLAAGSVRFTDRNGTVLYEIAVYPGRAVSATGFRDILKRILSAYRNE